MKPILSCPQELLIKVWLDGELDPARAGVLMGHVPSCPKCQAAVAECQRITSRLRYLGDTPAPPPPRVDSILTAAFRRVEEEGRTIRSLQRVALVAAAVLVCAVAFLFFPLNGHQSAEASRDNVMALVLSDPSPMEDY